MALAGAGIGGVLVLVLWRLAPPATSPLVQLGRFDARPAAAPSATVAAAPASPVERAGRALAGLLARRGVGYTSLRQDLALVGRSYEAELGRKLLTAGYGLLLAAVALTGLQLAAGISLPPGGPVVVALLVAAVFFMLPDIDARKQAAARRADFRRAFGSYLDLVALEMAGSAAPAEALPAAAKVGTGWPLALLRDTLYRATRSGKDAWAALTELGGRIGVAELADLGTLVQLVAHDGARVRATLTARAASMRRRALAEAEGAAGERDESMRLAQILIGFGFVVLIGYPAIQLVLST